METINEYSAHIDNYTTVIQEDKQYLNVKTYPYKILIIGLFFATATFMAALAWNSAITDTLTFVAERTGIEKDFDLTIPVGRIIVLWFYTISITILLLVMLYIFKDIVPFEFLIV